MTPDALGDGLPGRRQQERRRHADRGGQEAPDEHDRVLTRPPATRSPGAAPASASSTTTITTASTTYTATAGTPASRCMAPAPASSAPNSTPVATTPSGCSRASRATAMPVKPYPGERFWNKRIGHAADLDPAGEAGECARHEQGHRAHPPSVDPPADLGGARARTHRAKPEPPERCARTRTRGRGAATSASGESRMQPRARAGGAAARPRRWGRSADRCAAIPAAAPAPSG